jgi:hypothetical protein
MDPEHSNDEMSITAIEDDSIIEKNTKIQRSPKMKI